MIVRSGLPLEVYFTKNGNEYQNVYLKGDARVIYRGVLEKTRWAKANTRWANNRVRISTIRQGASGCQN